VFSPKIKHFAPPKFLGWLRHSCSTVVWKGYGNEMIYYRSQGLAGSAAICLCQGLLHLTQILHTADLAGDF